MLEPKAYQQLNPFTAIWTRPRETVRYVIEEKRDSFIFLLIVLVGFSAGLSGASSGGELFPVWGVILGALILGPISAAVGTAIISGIYKLLGKLFGGVGTYSEMFRAVTTANIPQIWIVPLWLVWLIMSPETFYTENDPFAEESGGGLIGLLALAAVFAVGVWTFIIQCKAVGEAQRFSAWKGFFVIVLPSLLIGAVIFVLALFIMFLAI